MAAITGDGVTAASSEWLLDYTNKKISKSASFNPTTRHTVNELYSWLMDLFDNASQMDDTVPMQANTPTEYAMINGWTFNSDSDVQYLYGGSIVLGGGTDIWANFYTLGSIDAGSVVYWLQNGASVATFNGYTTGHIDQLIKVRSGGVDIDSKYVTGLIRNLGYTYDNFKVQASATGGRNPVPLATAVDINDDGLAASFPLTVAFGTVSRDIGDGAGAQNYDVEIDCTGYSCLQVYRYLKYHTRRQETGAIGTGNATQGRFYQSANLGTYAETKAAPFGTFAGGKFFGARGIWLKNPTDPMNMQLIDAAGNVRTPPVSISVAVTGVVAGDQVLVARSSAGVVNKAQFTISSTTSASITPNAAIPADVPSSGTIRVGDTQFTYTSKTGGVFGGVTPSPAGMTGGFYVPLIDGMATGSTITSLPMTYLADFPIIARVRKKGILPFENTGTVGNSGLTISAIRTTDTIVS